MNAILNNEVKNLNPISAGLKAKLTPAELEQYTEYEGVWYFNPQGAVIIPDLPAKPSKYHKWNGTEWIPDTTKKQELITAIRAKIDADTDAKILNDFKFEGVGFKLSLENQMNYKAEHELRDTLTYPHKVKSIDGYHQFQDATEYHHFYLSAVAFIRSTIEAGWDAKDALEGMTTEELIDLYKDRCI